MKEYNEVYGYLPESVINHLSEDDKRLAFLSWLTQKPSAASMFIAQVTIKALGPEFIEFLTLQAAQANEDNDVPLTKELLASEVKCLLEEFATDSNILCSYVADFLEEHESDQNVISRVKEEMSLRNWKQNPGIMEQFKKTLANEKASVQNRPVRDPKTGRFIKKNKR